MTNFQRGILTTLFCLASSFAFAQPDSLHVNLDSIAIDSVLLEAPNKPHFPRKATMFSAVLPGLGQVYNKQWWKVPFIYGGLGAIGYFIYDENSQFIQYRQAWVDLDDQNPATDSYYEILYETDETIVVDESSTASTSNYKQIIYTKIESAKSQRDFYIIVAAGFYLFNILDANVSAHFLDFDISEDLSLNLTPNVGTTPINKTPSPGLTLVYNF